MVEIAVDGSLSGCGIGGPQRLTFSADGPLHLAPRRDGARTGQYALPGFVDAHVHLELSRVRGEEIAHPTFAAWVAALIERQRNFGPGERAAAARDGAAQLLANGCVAIGDIDAQGETFAALANSPLEGVIYREWLGSPSAALAAELDRRFGEQAARLERVAASGAERPRRRLGLSPHAPYSTSAELYERAFEWSRRHQVPLASHVAESQDELDLLAADRGPLRELFTRLRFAPPRWPRASEGALTAVAALAPPRGFVVIHGNRLRAAEIATCATSGWPVVFCPRSHAYFRYERHPSRELFDAGAIVALGTDSRASNLGLDLHAELAAWRSADAALSDAELFAAATANGRVALGLPRAELMEGDPATFQLVSARDGAPMDSRRLEAAAVRGDLVTEAVFIRGELAWSAERGVIARPSE